MPRRGRRRDETERGSLAMAAMRHRRELVAVALAVAAVLTIFVNALFLQHGPHPAPIFPLHQQVKPEHAAPAVGARRSADAEPARRAKLIADIQRALAHRGFYDGPTDGIWGARTANAARDFAQAAGVKTTVEASEAFLEAVTASPVRPQGRPAAEQTPRDDPIAKLLAPSTRVQAVQRALADFGYGQVKPTGVYDAATRSAIERFQRDRRLPVNGELTDDTVRELAAVTGRRLE